MSYSASHQKKGGGVEPGDLVVKASPSTWLHIPNPKHQLKGTLDAEQIARREWDVGLEQ